MNILAVRDDNVKCNQTSAEHKIGRFFFVPLTTILMEAAAVALVFRFFLLSQHVELTLILVVKDTEKIPSYSNASV